MKNLESASFVTEIQNGYVMVDFSASWCPDCRFIEPMLEALDKEFEQVRFYKVGFDTELSLKDRFNIRKIPTLMFFKNGEEVGERLIEPRSIESIRDMLNTLIKA